MKSYRPFSLRHVFAFCTAWLMVDLLPLDQGQRGQSEITGLNLTQSALAEEIITPSGTPNNAAPSAAPPATPSGSPSGTPPSENRNKSPKNNNRRIKYEYAQNNDKDYYFTLQPFYGFNYYEETVDGKPFMKEVSEYLTGLTTEFNYDSTQFVANLSLSYGFGTVTYSAYADNGSTYSTPGSSISYIEPRASLGYYVPGFLSNFPEIGLTPMFGVGWRYYRNDLRGKAYSPSEDSIYNGYRRTISYIYLPAGLVFSSPRPLIDDGAWSLTLEYDAFISGTVNSYTGDTSGCTSISPCPSGTYSNPLTNVQSIGTGYGLRASAMYMYHNIGFSPYFINWSIEDSNKIPCGRNSFCLEPKNQYYEYGLRLVFRY